MDVSEVYDRLPEELKALLTNPAAYEDILKGEPPGAQITDLTTDGILQVISDLRAQKRNAEANRLERKFRPLWTRQFPRRRYDVFQSSYGRALRVELLPENFYFIDDVTAARYALGLPKDGLGSLVDDITEVKAWPYETSSEDRRSWEVGAATNRWLSVHRRHALGQPPLETPLPQPISDSAQMSAQLGFEAPTLPEWLRQEPQFPEPFRHTCDPRVPGERIAMRLVERYRLPWLSVRQVLFFILTDEVDALRRISPLDVRVEPVNSPLGQSYRIIIEPVDEYTTRGGGREGRSVEGLWHEVWDRHVIPAQSHLWRQRGAFPSTDRPVVNELRHGLELYALARRSGEAEERIRRLAEHKKREGRQFDPGSVPKNPVDGALAILSLEGKPLMSRKGTDDQLQGQNLGRPT